jgi:CRISPR system Cascade subunit CasE
MPVNMLQIQPDLAALVAFLQTQGLNNPNDEDMGYGLHAWLKAVFGNLAPRPFRLFGERRNRKPLKLLAYTTYSKEELLEQATAFAEPMARTVCALEHASAVARLPELWTEGRRLAFELLACPVVRKSASGKEKDVFLQRADQAGPDARLRREDVYAEWLARQLSDAARLESCFLDGFRLVRQLRRPASPNRRESHLRRPQALLRGTVQLRDSDAFNLCLERGIGRHRAFGYGMLLLRPAE